MFRPLTNVTKRFIQTSVIKLKGHSKWQNIKNIKADNDALRAQTIRRQMRFLRVAINDGGSANPDINPMLRSAIDEALRRYVPKATVTLFLKKMSDSKDKTAIQRYIFEGRLFKRMYVVISIFADNYALTKIQMATVFRKHLVEQIQAKRMFNERGVFNVIARDGISIENIEEECLNDAVECGADDIEVYNATERQVTFFCDPKDFLKVRHKLSTAGHKIEQSECAFFPNNKLVQLTEAELKDYNKFKERLLAIDGFDEIYDNVEDDDS